MGMESAVAVYGMAWLLASWPEGKGESAIEPDSEMVWLDTGCV